MYLIEEYDGLEFKEIRRVYKSDDVVKRLGEHIFNPNMTRITQFNNHGKGNITHIPESKYHTSGTKWALKENYRKAYHYQRNRPASMYERDAYKLFKSHIKKNRDCIECSLKRVRHEGKVYTPHGFSYMISNLLNNLDGINYIYRVCKNPICVNPKHLRVGSRKRKECTNTKK